MNDQFMFEALQRRQKMMGQSINPYDKMGTPTQMPGDMAPGGLGMGTHLDKSMNVGAPKKGYSSIKTK